MIEPLMADGKNLAPTAVHEAGHAVACARLFPNIPIESVTIVPSLDDEYAGLFTGMSDVDTVSLETGENEADAYFSRASTFVCAGYGALVALGWSEADAALGCEGDFELSGHRLDEGKLAAVVLMNEPRNLAAVRLVAHELMLRKTLDGDHVQVLLDLADGEITNEEYAEHLALRRI